VVKIVAKLWLVKEAAEHLAVGIVPVNDQALEALVEGVVEVCLGVG